MYGVKYCTYLCYLCTSKILRIVWRIYVGDNKRSQALGLSLVPGAGQAIRLVAEWSGNKQNAQAAAPFRLLPDSSGTKAIAVRFMQ